MNERWDLTPLYRGFEDEKWTGDMAGLTKDCREFTDFPGKSEALPQRLPFGGTLTAWRR